MTRSRLRRFLCPDVDSRSVEALAAQLKLIDQKLDAVNGAIPALLAAQSATIEIATARTRGGRMSRPVAAMLTIAFLATVFLLGSSISLQIASEEAAGQARILRDMSSDAEGRALVAASAGLGELADEAVADSNELLASAQDVEERVEGARPLYLVGAVLSSAFLGAILGWWVTAFADNDRSRGEADLMHRSVADLAAKYESFLDANDAER